VTTLAFFVGKVVSLEQLLAWVSKFAILALIIAVSVVVVPIWLETRSSTKAEE
jgi:membrane protein DedA with SNARE-associated domain